MWNIFDDADDNTSDISTSTPSKEKSPKEKSPKEKSMGEKQNYDEVELSAMLEAVYDFTVNSESPWELDALCAETDPDTFFPEKGGSPRDAKAVCQFCPVKTQCLELALANEEHFGVWGGTSETERRAIKRERAKAAEIEESSLPIKTGTGKLKVGQH